MRAYVCFRVCVGSIRRRMQAFKRHVAAIQIQRVGKSFVVRQWIKAGKLPVKAPPPPPGTGKMKREWSVSRSPSFEEAMQGAANADDDGDDPDDIEKSMMERLAAPPEKRCA